MLWSELRQTPCKGGGTWLLFRISMGACRSPTSTEACSIPMNLEAEFITPRIADVLPSAIQPTASAIQPAASAHGEEKGPAKERQDV